MVGSDRMSSVTAMIPEVVENPETVIYTLEWVKFPMRLSNPFQFTDKEAEL